MPPNPSDSLAIEKVKWKLTVKIKRFKKPDNHHIVGIIGVLMIGHPVSDQIIMQIVVRILKVIPPKIHDVKHSTGVNPQTNVAYKKPPLGVRRQCWLKNCTCHRVVATPNVSYWQEKWHFTLLELNVLIVQQVYLNARMFVKYKKLKMFLCIKTNCNGIILWILSTFY